MRILRQTLLAFLILASPPAFASEQQPQAIPDADQRRGENLTERLDRTDGVIRPPPVDDAIQVAPPANRARTPIIRPGDAPDQQVSPR
jgi:hypothetical protein